MPESLPRTCPICGSAPLLTDGAAMAMCPTATCRAHGWKMPLSLWESLPADQSVDHRGSTLGQGMLNDKDIKARSSFIIAGECGSGKPVVFNADYKNN